MHYGAIDELEHRYCLHFVELSYTALTAVNGICVVIKIEIRLSIHCITDVVLQHNKLSSYLHIQRS